MLISDKNLIGLPVNTKGGDYLGKVAGLDVDTSSGEIIKYRVKSPGLMNWFKIAELIIDKSQVLEITREKMTVMDLMIKETETAKTNGSRTVPVNHIEPVITNKLD